MFYDNLIKECTQKGLKVTPIVTECGGASGSISAWKKGSMPNSDIVLKLSMRLNVSCDYLLTGKYWKNATVEPLLENEQELLSIYNMLDSRGKHKLHTTIYDELDRIKQAGETPRLIPFAASGEADITTEDFYSFQETLQQFDKRAKELEGR